MSQIACKYHYDLPARWSCHACRIDYCTNCVKPMASEQTPVCPVCDAPLTVVGAENVVIPFWQRLHHFFMYPLQPVPLGILVLLTVLIAALGNTLFGPLTLIVSLLVFMKYSYVVLEDTSHGYLLPQPFSSEMISQGWELPFKHVLNVLLVIGVNYLAYTYSVKLENDYLFYLVFSVTIFFLPVSVMLLAVKRSFSSAFNPALLVHTVRSIGIAYALLYFFVLMMLSSASATIFYINNILPDSFHLTIDSFIAMFFVLSIFNMLGYVLYQYHERIGFGVDVEVSSSLGDKVSDGLFILRTPAMVDIEILVQEGDYNKALKKLEHLIQTQPSDMHARTYYQKLLHLLGDIDTARQHCADFVGRLMAEKKPTQAMNVFIACYRQDNETTLSKASQRMAMAKLLMENGKHRIAMHLLNNLHQDHPSYSEIPEAYLIVAKMMSDQFNQDDKAIDILRFVIERYPHNKGIDEVKEYLGILQAVTQNNKVTS